MRRSDEGGVQLEPSEQSEIDERILTPAELDAYVHAPMSDAEREDRLELVAWFLRRYPTPAERMAYSIRATAAARWLAKAGAASRRSPG